MGSMCCVHGNSVVYFVSGIAVCDCARLSSASFFAISFICCGFQCLLALLLMFIIGYVLKDGFVFGYAMVVVVATAHVVYGGSFDMPFGRVFAAITVVGGMWVAHSSMLDAMGPTVP